MRHLRTTVLLSLLLACAGDKSGGEGTAEGGEDTSASGPDSGGDGGEEGPFSVDCPGSAGCESNEGPLMAGAAVRDVTPCFEQWVDVDEDDEYRRSTDEFLDCGCDHLCPGDDGYTAPDEGEGDGTFQATWLAGFGQGRPGNSVNDPIEARAVVIASGDTSVALVTLDVVGWFYDDAVAVREAAAAAGAEVDLIVVHATHNHEAPDTMGQWGESFGRRGVDEAHRQQIIDDAGAAVAEAAASLQEVELVIGSADSAAPFGSKGTRNTVRDSRDPVVIDEQVGAAALVASDGSTVATLINWGNHPEVLSSDNTALTADFVHYLRTSVEDGLAYDSRTQAGRGGTAVFINAAVGGLMTPLGITVTDWDGVDHGSSDFSKARALGDLIGGLALDALEAGTTATEPRVSVRAREFNVPVENIAFQALFLAGIFDRHIFNYDDTQPLSDTNVPEVRTEMDLVEIGPLRMLTVPGELTPELAIGGYDGSRVNTDEDVFIDEGNDNPPDVASAPPGPYLKDEMGAEHNWIIGLGNDEVGYLVPPYDYVLDERLPYINEAPGDHYEETNSIGPSVVPLILETATLLIEG